jgi:hypothetical protein
MPRLLEDTIPKLWREKSGGQNCDMNTERPLRFMLDAGKREQGRRLRRVNQQIKIAIFGPGEEPGGGEAGARGATVHAAVRRAAAMTHTGGTAFAGLGLIVLWSTGLALVLVWLARRPTPSQARRLSSLRPGFRIKFLVTRNAVVFCMGSFGAPRGSLNATIVTR